MGFVDGFDPSREYEALAAAGFATRAIDAAVEREMCAMRPWAGLSGQGRILISIEQLERGHRADLLLSHETAHDDLWLHSLFGLQLLLLATIALPPWPDGLLSQRARRLLTVGMTASTMTQEGCATLLPAIRLDDAELAAYWSIIPPGYRDAIAPLDWLRSRALGSSVLERLVLAIGTVALGVRIPTSCFVELAAACAWLREPTHHPDSRFRTICAALSAATDVELEIMSAADSPEDEVLSRCFPEAAAGNGTYARLVAGESVEHWWSQSIRELVDAWCADVRLPAAERELLAHAADDPRTTLPYGGPLVLKAILTNTLAASGEALDHPPVDRLLPYRLALISYNILSTPTPGVELVDGRSLPLAADEVALWLDSPGRPSVAARLSSREFREYMRRIDVDVTLCVLDAPYDFESGDILMLDEPLFHGRPHIVFVQQQVLGRLVDQINSVGINGERRAIYTVISAEVPGAAYFLVKPGLAHWPLVIAPVPLGTAMRAQSLLRDDSVHNVDWQQVDDDPPQFVAGDTAQFVHMSRVFATFEHKPWPPLAERNIASLVM